MNNCPTCGEIDFGCGWDCADHPDNHNTAFGWIFPDKDYGYFKINNGIGTITKLENGLWRWEVDKINILIVNMDGWWGVEKSRKWAMLKVEKEL